MDPRIARTRRSLQDALLELARERELDDISVADIAERAGVNRSSFYQHYADKETLLADAIDAAAIDAGADLPLPVALTLQPPDVLIKFLRHIDQNAAVYRRTFSARGSGVAVDRLRRSLESIALEGLDGSNRQGPDGIPRDILAAGVAGSVLAMVQAWIARDPHPSADVAAHWVWRVLLGPAALERPQPPR